MGSSKKHRADRESSSRKRKAHSRSHSPSEVVERVVERVKERHARDGEKDKERHTRDGEKEKERHHSHRKRHHKEKRKEKSSREHKVESDGDEAEDSIAVPPPPKISRPATPPPPAITAYVDSGSRSDSLSVDETNKLRARLGLKPLEAKAEPVAHSTKTAQQLAGGTDMGEFVHKPAESITARAKQDKVKARLREHREKRQIDARLARVKTLGEADEDEDASAWVKKSRAMQLEKDKANKRAAMLEELDAEFGVAALVAAEERTDRSTAYTARHLRGLRVEHSAAGFDEGRSVILTLKDRPVLDGGEDDEGDVLVNVNMVDDERHRKNVQKRKALPGYSALAEPELDEAGGVAKGGVLSKYDEEIDGEAAASFAIGEDVSAELRRRAMQLVRDRLHGKTAVSLQLPAMRLAAEYYTPEEAGVKFNKTRKKVRKTRKKLKADDLVPPPPPLIGGREGTAAKREPGVIIDDDDSGAEVGAEAEAEGAEKDEGEAELQLALQKARKLKLQQEMVKRTWGLEDAGAAQVASHVAGEGGGGDDPGGYITLNATAEFCRTLGDIPTYGLAGNRDEDTDELMDYERELGEEKRRMEDEGYRGAWNAVKIDERAPVEAVGAAAGPEVPILDAEPDLGMGVAGALRLAVSKGYLEREDTNKPSASRFAHLNAQNYSIEDKTHIDDDKFGRRERYSGPTSDFKEKANFQPNVKLDYIDDEGHLLSAKEAFRYLSHKFHGKGPGKNKVEKRMKKNEQEGLMKCMSSTDTPLGTLNLLQQKQRETQSAFVVLSGTKQATSISKTKH